MNRQPNVLLIVTDQHRADHLGCYGNAVVRTPHIDGIARRGVRFDRFYVASPICMPNRSTLMTGRMPAAGLAGYNGMQGHSLLPVIAKDAPLRDAILVEEDGQRGMFGFTEAPRVRTIVTPTTRMSVYAGAAWGELYDLAQDPTESENRWSDLRLRAEHLERLAQTSLELWDRSPAPTGRA